MSRTKYATRTIPLSDTRQRDIALAALSNAPLDADRPVECVIREQVKVRGLDQNGLYWLRLGEIAAQAWFDGAQFSKDTWHIYCGKNIMPEMITDKDGTVRTKWEPIPGGGAAVISTTQLERKCFADYTTAVEAFGAQLGVMFSANPREAAPRRAAA